MCVQMDPTNTARISKSSTTHACGPIIPVLNAGDFILECAGFYCREPTKKISCLTMAAGNPSTYVKLSSAYNNDCAALNSITTQSISLCMKDVSTALCYDTAS